MNKHIPTIQKYMTVIPHTVGIDQTLKTAKEMMSKHNVRHLPVLKAGKLVGILSDRDIKTILDFKDTDAETLTVDDVYTPEPYITSPSAHLNEVVALMAEKKYGSALVVDNNKLVGIFTEIDALKALSDLLETRLKN
jgi:acetoin utilization protein AcuB